MRIIMFILLTSIFVYANVIDDYNIYKAQKSYEEKEYQDALNYLNKVNKADSKIYYNKGNTLYKLGNYEEAINEYLKVTNSKLLHSVNHNIANAYIMLEDLDKAVEFYNKALVYKNDEKTIYNLEIIKQKIKLQNERLTKDLNENVCEIQRKGLIEELTRNTLFDYYDLDEKIKLFEDRLLGLSTKNENSKITDVQKEEDIYIDDKLRVKEEIGKGQFKMNSYFDKKFDKNIEIEDAKTLIVPIEKGIVDDDKKAW